HFGPGFELVRFTLCVNWNAKSGAKGRALWKNSHSILIQGFTGHSLSSYSPPRHQDATANGALAAQLPEERSFPLGEHSPEVSGRQYRFSRIARLFPICINFPGNPPPCLEPALHRNRYLTGRRERSRSASSRIRQLVRPRGSTARRRRRGPGCRPSKLSEIGRA